DGEIVEGKITTRLKFLGTPAHPLVNGTFDWENGKVDILKTGGILTHIFMNARIDNNHFVIKKCTAKDEKHGELHATGTMTLSAKEEFPFRLHCHAKKMELIKRDFATVTAKGNVDIHGNF